jgi:hypothetical protein
MIITISSLKTGYKFPGSTEQVIQALVCESQLEKWLQAIARAAHIDCPIDRSSKVDRYKTREKKVELARCASLQSQGKAVKAFTNNNIANECLLNPKILRPSKFVTALKMRVNIARDKAALARAKIKGGITWRKCHTQKETLGRILGQCTYTKRERIRRHSGIKNVLEKVVERDKEAVGTWGDCAPLPGQGRPQT